MMQPRERDGKFGVQGGECKGDAIALRLPASLDHAVRAAAGWHSKADNDALRAWVEGAIKDRVAGSASPAPTAGIDVSTVRAAANYIAVRVPIKSRTVIVKAFDALVGELLANGE